MKGNIYTTEKCPRCTGTMDYEPQRSGCFCPWCDTKASGNYYVKYGAAIRKRFAEFKDAEVFLTGLRFKDSEGTLDVRDYAAEKPLAFSNLVELYLKEKTRLKTYRDIERMLFSAVDEWGDRNIKTIARADIKTWLAKVPNEKTRANYRSALSRFNTWVLEEEYIEEGLHIPAVSYELGWRHYTDWPTQNAIMDQIAKLSWAHNPKVWFGIDILRTYTSLRPGDLTKITEFDMDVTNGTLTVMRPTKRKKDLQKTLRLLDRHVELLRQIKAAFPATPAVKFFRHHFKHSGAKAGQPFGEKHLYKWWVRACANLGIEGLDMYGGTRHTTTTQLAKAVGRDGAKELSGHKTNKAFDRYCQMEGERAFEMAKVVISKTDSPHHPSTMVIDFDSIRKAS